MSQKNIKELKSAKGFTIVELLIVIVVIGILAAITLVAYNGVQNRAKGSAGQALANSIVKKAEIYNAIGTGYAADRAALILGTGEAKIDDQASVVAGVITAANANSGKAVGYVGCGTGANVWYWDYAAATPIEKKVIAGTGC